MDRDKQSILRPGRVGGGWDAILKICILLATGHTFCTFGTVKLIFFFFNYLLVGRVFDWILQSHAVLL